MSLPLIDLTNQQFGRLTVQGRAVTSKRGSYWRCKCACGGESIVHATHLKHSHTRSCGCIRAISDAMLEAYREQRLSYREKAA